jgi:hypothetical protein
MEYEVELGSSNQGTALSFSVLEKKRWIQFVELQKFGSSAFLH